MTKKFEHNTDIGQNFLRDRGVAEWMASRPKFAGGERVLEIGPGEGVLTDALLVAPVASLDAIELDTRLAPALSRFEADARFSLHWGDAVAFDYSQVAPPTHVVANLPYHITTPVIWSLLESFSGRGLKYMLLMLQREAADRISSGAGERESCPLGITLRALGEARIARRVPRGAFVPMPRVESAVVEMRLSGDLADLPRDRVWRRLIAGSFAHRRKTLANNWSASFGSSREASQALLAEMGRPETLRPEEASLDDWLAFLDAARSGRLGVL